MMEKSHCKAVFSPSVCKQCVGMSGDVCWEAV